jgi:ElaB/YqjD/DUF883 family membrane-anchored ribosome-binding protein
MSENMAADEGRDTADLLDADGRMIDPGSGEATDPLKQVENYIRSNPIKAAGIALAIGYVLGRLRLVV